MKALVFVLCLGLASIVKADVDDCLLMSRLGTQSCLEAARSDGWSAEELDGCLMGVELRLRACLDDECS